MGGGLIIGARGGLYPGGLISEPEGDYILGGL